MADIEKKDTGENLPMGAYRAYKFGDVKTYEEGAPMDRIMRPLKPIEPLPDRIEPTKLMDKSTKGSPSFTAAELAQGYRVIKE